MSGQLGERERGLGDPSQPVRPAPGSRWLGWRWRLALLAAGTAVWLARGWPRITRPTLWAEDGTVFLTDAYHGPLAAVVEPYRGYLHLVPRLVALLASPLPLTWQPAVYAVAGVGGAVATAGLVLSARLRWLLPRPWQPPLAFGLLAVLPAADETYANIANLIFFAGLALLLLALCDDPRTRAGRWLEPVGLAVLGLSGPFALLVLPAYLGRWWRLRSAASAPAAAVVLGTAAVQSAILAFGSSRPTSNLTAAEVPRFLGQDVVGSWLFTDRWGGRWGVAMTVAVLVWTAAFLLVGWRRAALGPALVVLLAVASAMATYRFWLVRPYAGERHVLIPLAVIVLLAVAGCADRRRWRRVLAAGCLLAGLGGIVGSVAVRPLPYRPIRPLADCLAAHRPVCTLQINPHRKLWTVTLTPRR